MSEWEPATEAEATMRDALAASDQELYFRILSRSELLLPVSAEALAGRAPMGWGTWTTSNRTHVLAFTSPAALAICLNESGGSYRTVPFHSLAGDWPNYEWWLAVNPGLPIEAYLPSWFVAQLTRGDVRLPGRSGSNTSARAAQSDLAAALSGRGRVNNNNEAPVEATVAVGVPTSAGAARATAWPGSQGWGDGNDAYDDPATETVDAEIIDYPSASGSARVFPPGSGYSDSANSQYQSATGTAGQPPVNPDLRSGQVPPAQAADNVVEAVIQAEVAVGPTAPTAAPPIAPIGPPRRDPRGAQDAEVVSVPMEHEKTQSWGTGFAPANETEVNLLAAAEANNTDAFLSTLLLARVILPVPVGTPSAARPRDQDFPWHVAESDGKKFIPVFTSPERLAEHSLSRFGSSVSSVSLRFVQLIGSWPDAEIAFAINPGSPVGATLPGSQIVALASWAAEVGLRDEPSADVVVAPKRAESTAGVAGAPATPKATVMQRTVPPAQIPFYLERGYDRVSGFVNRASEVAQFTSPKALYRALGLVYTGSPFSEDDRETYVLRWVAHRTDLYRIPYGGQHEAGMRAMQGWVIERPPFRGNSFAPSDSEVVAEFKVDSVRLPHGAQIWRLTMDGSESMVATFDADTSRWIPTSVYGGPYA